jgi:hypothetical protein
MTLIVSACPHGRQPSICAICVPILEAQLATKKRREEEDRRRRQDDDDFMGMATIAAIATVVVD